MEGISTTNKYEAILNRYKTKKEIMEKVILKLIKAIIDKIKRARNGNGHKLKTTVGIVFELLGKTN